MSKRGGVKATLMLSIVSALGIAAAYQCLLDNRAKAGINKTIGVIADNVTRILNSLDSAVADEVEQTEDLNHYQAEVRDKWRRIGY